MSRGEPTLELASAPVEVAAPTLCASTRPRRRPKVGEDLTTPTLAGA